MVFSFSIDRKFLVLQAALFTPFSSVQLITRAMRVRMPLHPMLCRYA